MANEIEKFVLDREISLLYHFTQIENLNSIIKHGILPRQTLIGKNIKHQFNDHHRIDGQLDASSFSIEWPNYKMFYSLRAANPKQKWVVLTVHRKVLWTKNCAFFCSNAASTEEITTPIEMKRGLSALKKIFDPVAGKPTREELKLENKYPTNPQAEVLVYDVVEPANIIHIICNDKKSKEELMPSYPNHKVLLHTPAFDPRADWKHWKK